MAFELDLTAGPLAFSIRIFRAHLAVFWGRHDAGFVLERDDLRERRAKMVETWRETGPGNLNVAAFGLHLIYDSGKPRAVPSAFI